MTNRSAQLELLNGGDLLRVSDSEGVRTYDLRSACGVGSWFYAFELEGSIVVATEKTLGVVHYYGAVDVYEGLRWRTATIAPSGRRALLIETQPFLWREIVL